jgi:hypothetical protein
MARFEAVALLCPRTSFIKAILCLEESEAFIRQQIHAVWDRHGTKLVLARGSTLHAIHGKSMSPVQRYAGSFLINTLLSTDCGGIDLDGGIVSESLLDRLVYSYRRHLSVFRLTASDADVSFELFYVLYRSYTLGEVDLIVCANCGSSFVNLKVYSVQCPLCARHGHATIRSRSSSSSSPDRFTSLIANDRRSS